MLPSKTTGKQKNIVAKSKKQRGQRAARSSRPKTSQASRSSRPGTWRRASGPSPPSRTGGRLRLEFSESGDDSVLGEVPEERETHTHTHFGPGALKKWFKPGLPPNVRFPCELEGEHGVKPAVRVLILECHHRELSPGFPFSST